MKTRTIIVLGCSALVLAFMYKVFSETRTTQRRADRMHAILKASRPDQNVSADLEAFLREDAESFQIKPCIRKPETAVECRSVRFQFENTWPRRFRLTSRKAMAGILVVADDRLVALSVGFGQFPDEIIAFTENGSLPYFPRIRDDSPVFKATMRHHFITPAESDQQRTAALDWDNSFLTDLRAIQNAQELLKSSSR